MVAALHLAVAGAKDVGSFGSAQRERGNGSTVTSVIG